MRSNRRLLLDVSPLVVWTALIWVSRIRNIWNDADLSTINRTLSTLIAVVFIALAVVTAAILWRSHAEGLTSWGSKFIVGFAAWTIGYWGIRAVEMLLDDHSGVFKAIHTVLALVSIGLAALAWRAATGISDRVMAEAQS
jgi:hypothetical protein